MPADDTNDDSTDTTSENDDFTVTPYAVEGEIDYDRLLDQFGAEELTQEDVAAFPEPVHTMLRRRVFYAGRDVDRFTEAAAAGEQVSLVTGVGPSGPMHLGHALVFYFAKHLQEQTGAHVYIPLSDDEKLFGKDLSPAERRRYTRDNVRDILGVGFDPDLTRIVVDTVDADAVYPQAARFAGDLTMGTVEAAYGEQNNPGLAFYPAMQATHLLLPQLVHGPHPTLVPVAVDQDPHVRVCRDLAGKQRYDVSKPATLLMKFLPQLGGDGGKMSSSEDGADAPPIYLTDDRETVTEKVTTHAYSGGKSSVEAHRREGGDPDVDVAYRYLHAFFEPDDDEVAAIARQYRDGELLSGELKLKAADAIASFLEAHQARRPAEDVRVAEAVEPYRLREEERAKLANSL
jgi:tryptophanyl-tRNA synthetase